MAIYGKESGAINVAQGDLARAQEALYNAIGLLRAQAPVWGWPAVDNRLTAIQNELSTLAQRLESEKQKAMKYGV